MYANGRPSGQAVRIAWVSTTNGDTSFIRPKEQDEFDGHLELEHRPITEKVMEAGYLGDGGLGERPPMPQCATRPEREHRHVEVTGHTDEIVQVRTPIISADLLEGRSGRLRSSDESEIKAGTEQLVSPFDLEPRGLVAVRPIALLGQLQVWVTAQALDDRNDPVRALAAKLLMPVVFVIAAVMLVQEDAPPEQIVPVLMLLSVVALGAFVAPFADAAFSHASERSADAYVARLGMGSDLAIALDMVAPPLLPEMTDTAPQQRRYTYQNRT